MKKISKIIKNPFDLLFVFKYVKIAIDVNSSIYDKQFEMKLKSQINQISKEICIDRTYVKFNGTKYKKTFIKEDGWNGLCSLLYITKFGKDANKEENDILHEAYRNMIIQYIYQLLQDYGYDIADINLEIAGKSAFMVEICENGIKDNYPGIWQTWDCNQ